MEKKELTKPNIIALLTDVENQQNVESFAAYCVRTKIEKDRSGNPKNPWMQNKTANEMAQLFKRVANEGLVFDGVHVTLQSRGISYDYIAYKNKMLLVYPESIIDIQLVYDGDDIRFSKKSGSVDYSHTFSNPFDQNENKIIGGYCVIKNKRGEFLTLISKAEIDKHRKKAKTDFIWKEWFKEMALKTIMRKAVKMHFDDVFAKMDEQDNENYDLEKPINIELEWKQEVETIETMGELKEYYQAHKGRGKEFAKMITQRKSELQPTTKTNENTQNN